MTDGLVIRQATESDYDAAVAWLTGANLPTADLVREHMPQFLAATTNDITVGIIGLEVFDDVGLLRSLVVDSSRRSKGIGQELLVALETTASRQGIAELWLLTIDADRFFARHGYVATERAEAPEVIRNTEEFSDLCPDDAVLMRKHL